jgi:hypothetical protein
MISHHALFTPFPAPPIQPRPTATPTHLIAFARPHDRFGAPGIATGQSGMAWRTGSPRHVQKPPPWTSAPSPHALQAAFQTARSTTGALPRRKAAFVFTRTYSTARHSARTLLTCNTSPIGTPKHAGILSKKLPGSSMLVNLRRQGRAGKLAPLSSHRKAKSCTGTRSWSSSQLP